MGGFACQFSPSGGAAGGDGDGTADASAAGDSGPGLDGSGADGAVSPSLFCAPTDGLVACYEFEGTLADGTGNHNDLTGLGVVFGEGHVNLGLSLIDASQMDPIDRASLDFSAALTVEAWIRPSQAQDRWFVDHHNQWGLQVEGDGDLGCIIVRSDDGGTTGIGVSGGDAVTGKWTHVACTYNGNQLQLYVDGDEVSDRGVEGPISTASTSGFTVGRDAPSGESFVGDIDQVRIWSRARSEQEIECDAGGAC